MTSVGAVTINSKFQTSTIELVTFCFWEVEANVTKIHIYVGFIVFGIYEPSENLIYLYNAVMCILMS